MIDYLFLANILSLIACIIAVVWFDQRMKRVQLAILGLGNAAALAGFAGVPTICVAIVLLLWAVEWRRRARHVAAKAKIDAAMIAGDFSGISDRDLKDYD